MKKGILLTLFLLSALPVMAESQTDSSKIKVLATGMTVIADGQTLAVQPLEVFPQAEEAVLVAGKPNWQGPVYLSNVAWRYRAMTKGSLKVRLDGKPLKEGTDYLIDYEWGTVGSPPNGTAIGKKVELEFTYTQTRLDLAVGNQNGEIEIIKGEPAMATPMLPQAPEGTVPLFSIYLPHNTTALSEKNINIMDSTSISFGPAVGTEFLKTKLDQLKSGHPFTFVFFGDSITAWQTTPPGKEFVARFTDWIQEKYPDRKIICQRLDPAKNEEAMIPATPAGNEIAIVMAGLGGDTSSMGLKRMEKHVLIHNPDIVFIMFGVNDDNRFGNVPYVSPDQYEKNLTMMIKKIREKGGEPVIMTTSMKNPSWSSGILPELARRARRVAEKNKVCLIDHYKAWEALPKHGYHYMILLDSCINHPNSMGHEMFFNGIKIALQKSLEP